MFFINQLTEVNCNRFQIMNYAADNVGLEDGLNKL